VLVFSVAAVLVVVGATVFKTATIFDTVSHIELSEFSHQGGFDDLGHRFLPDHDIRAHVFRTELSVDEVLDLGVRPAYRMVVYRMAAAAYQVRFNGVLLGSVGAFENPSGNLWNAYQSFTIDPSVLRRQNVVEIEVLASGEFGLTAFPIVITDSQSEQRLALWLESIIGNVPTFAIPVLLLMFVIFLVLGASPGMSLGDETLYFAPAVLCTAVHMLYYVTIHSLPTPIFLFSRIVISAIYLAGFFFGLAIYARYRYRPTAVFAWALLPVVLVPWITSASWGEFHSWFPVMNLVLLGGIVSWALAARRRFRSDLKARVLVIGSVGAVLFLGSDVLLRLLMGFRTVGLGVFGILVLIAALVVVVLDDYFSLYQKASHNRERAALMYEKSIRDSMTDLFNHGYMFDILRGLRGKYTVLMLDLDNFKELNDAGGHALGDDVLRFVAGKMKELAGDETFLGRYGGDEFIAIMLDAGQPEAERFAQALKSTIESKVLETDQGRFGVQVSIGIAVHTGNVHGGEATMEAADAALYQAKHSGKGCITAVSMVRRRGRPADVGTPV